MKLNNQSGVTTLQIIIIVAVIAVSAGIIATLMSEPAGEPAEITENDTDMAAEQAPIEQMAETMAESETADMMDVVGEPNIELETEITNETESELTATPVAPTPLPDAEPVTAVDPEPVVASNPGTFSDYSADKLALAADGTVVLFFHANWCPSCRALESDLNASLSDIPADTHILKLDYDTETELKKKYGVVRQHTLVVVDANGNEVKKLNGLTNTLEQVVNQL